MAGSICEAGCGLPAECGHQIVEIDFYSNRYSKNKTAGPAIESSKENGAARIGVVTVECSNT
jgi:hypothetical protein